jgi:hypothetical protein
VDRNRASYRRIGSTVAIATLIVVVFVAVAALGAAATGTAGAAATQYKKVTLCHKGEQTITVGATAAEAHRRHGDTPGPCP